MADKAATVVVWGDSIAASEWPQRMEFSYNVCLNTGRAIRVVNKGVGGMPAARARAQFETVVLPEHPEVVIMQFGLNDLRHDGSRGDLPISTPEEFGEHLRAMIRDCAERAKARVMVFGNHVTRVPLTLPTGLSYHETRARYNVVAEGAARKSGVRFVDIPAVIAAAGFMPAEVLSDDGVHLSPRGVSVYAHLAASAVRSLLVEAGMVGVTGRLTERSVFTEGAKAAKDS